VWQRSSGLAGLAAVALIVAIVGISHRATQADELDWGLSNIEGALHKIESKLSASFGSPPPAVVPGVGFHPAKHTMHRLPWHEWTDTDEKHHDSNMGEAIGEAGTKPYDGIHLLSSFIPISDVAMQKQYAHNLVEVLRNLKSRRDLEEMPKWAENGPTAENSYSARSTPEGQEDRAGHRPAQESESCASDEGNACTVAGDVQMLRRVILNAATPGRKGGDDHTVDDGHCCAVTSKVLWDCSALPSRRSAAKKKRGRPSRISWAPYFD
jgi:hypothetical protein